MFANNPFSHLATTIAPVIMQGFVVVMVAFVVLGTLYDMAHKKSGRYFFENWRKTTSRATRRVGSAEAVSLAIRTAFEGLASGEFCNVRRRISHLLTMYGFLFYAVTTVAMVFWYSGPDLATPAVLPVLWHLGALMICAGGYWFWFFLRVDVATEGRSPFRVGRPDVFILSLLANATLALVWSWLAPTDSGWSALSLVLYVLSAIVLFGSVPWSKFSHMFYKPAAAFQKRVEDACGTRGNLPMPADKPEVFGSVPRIVRHY